MANLFAKAKQNATSSPQKKPKTSGKPEISVPGLNQLAAIDTIAKTIEGIRSSFEGMVKNAAVDHFVKEGLALGRQPENVRGTDTHSSASLEMRKRSTRSTFSPEDVKLLKLHGIFLDKGETKVTTYMINPKYESDEKLLGRVSKALEMIDVPADFLEYQEGAPVYTTNDQTIDSVFAAGLGKAMTEELLKLVTTIAAKPKYELSLEEALEFMKTLVKPKKPN